MNRLLSKTYRSQSQYPPFFLCVTYVNLLPFFHIWKRRKSDLLLNYQLFFNLFTHQNFIFSQELNNSWEVWRVMWRFVGKSSCTVKGSSYTFWFESGRYLCSGVDWRCHQGAKIAGLCLCSFLNKVEVYQLQLLNTHISCCHILANPRNIFDCRWNVYYRIK